MTDAAPPRPSDLRVVHPAWLWGGILLISSTLPPLLRSGGQPVLTWLADVLFLGSMLLFALGPDSVTARRPLGTASLLLFGAWPLALEALWLLIGPGGPGGDALYLTPFLQSSHYLQLGLGVLATVQIARAGVLHGPWRLVPLAGLVVAVGWVGLEFALFMLGTRTEAIATLAGVGHIVACIGLGVVAVVLSTTSTEAVGAMPDMPSGR